MKGTYTVTLTVTDNAGATPTSILVETPANASGDLGAPVLSNHLKSAVWSGLTDRLDAVVAALNANSKKTAANNLNAFISLVKARAGRR